MARIIDSFQLAFNAPMKQGEITFHEVGNPVPVRLQGLSAEDFTAIAMVLTQSNTAYANNGWIYTGKEPV